MILLEVPPAKVFVLERPSQAWKTVVQESNRIQRKLFIKADTVVAKR